MNHEQLIADGWVQTDASTNQYRKEVIEDQIYLFIEDRLADPVSGRMEVYEAEMNYDDYDWWQITEACEAFGYDVSVVDKWIESGEEIPLMLECLFELSN